METNAPDTPPDSDGPDPLGNRLLQVARTATAARHSMLEATKRERLFLRASLAGGALLAAVAVALWLIGPKSPPTSSTDEYARRRVSNARLSDTVDGTGQAGVRSGAGLPPQRCQSDV